MRGAMGRQAWTTGLAVLMAGLCAESVNGQPQSPTYIATWSDCVTSDNQFVGGDGIFYWDVDTGCDVYQQDVYERPMTQTFYATQGRYGAVEYFEYLDLTGASAGFDDQYLYVQLDLAGRDHLTSDGTVIPLGMVERYGFRLSTDPDGRYGVLIVADQPELKNDPNTVFGPIGTFGYRDTDGDVGGADLSGPTGLGVTKSDNPDEEGGTLNGYDAAIISDGRLEDETPVLWVRLSPNDPTHVEFALDYAAIGFSADDLRSLGYLHFEAIKGGPKDPQNYLWNDKYTREEAGSPNPGPGGESEFGTEGLENIYEADTLAGGSIRDADDPDAGGDGGPDAPDGGPDGGDVPTNGAGPGDSPDGGSGTDGGSDTDGDDDSAECGPGLVAMLPVLAVGYLALSGRRGRNRV